MERKSRKIIRWDFPLLRAWSERPTLIFEKPPIHELFETQMAEQLFVSEVGIVDSDIKELEDEKRREWTSRGYTMGLQDKAIELAREWTSRIVEWQLRSLRGVLTEDEIRRVGAPLTKRLFKEALDSVAERWISAMSE